MDLIDELRKLSARIPKLEEKGLVTTEEGTKNALIMPFINALGYNVFDPTEVTPELTADIGTKKGEKVDYAILNNNQPVILFECKKFSANLTDTHVSQLYRYFSVTDARFGVLTNGVEYHFYSDLEEENKMDSRPFMIFDLSDVSERAVEAIKRFTKSAFDQEKSLTMARQLKYRNAIKQTIEQEFTAPSDELVRLCVKDAYTGRFTQSVIEEFRDITKGALRGFINDQVGKRLKTALASEEEPPEELEVEEEETDAPKIVTTQEELNAYYMIKSIVRDVIDVERVIMRDAQSFCNILIDDTLRKNLCRLRFDDRRKSIAIFDEEKNETRYPVDGVDDIYNYAEQIRERARYFADK
jgi:predicted type IV restriction endonuclease